MKVGVLGGTFDPIHIAHTAVAEEARRELELDYIVFIPAGQPWMKEGQLVSPASLRLEMVKKAIAKAPFFKVSSLEVESSKPSYTIETILALHRELGEGVELNLILGADALAQMPQWKNPAQILEICTLVVVDRPGHGRTQGRNLDEPLPGMPGKMKVLRGPLLSISGTEIRRRVAEGTSIRHLVSEKVERFIVENNLYVKGENNGQDE
jgi:nicotinate-nucleotide adenylyltransferase